MPEPHRQKKKKAGRGKLGKALLSVWETGVLTRQVTKAHGTKSRSLVKWLVLQHIVPQGKWKSCFIHGDNSQSYYYSSKNGNYVSQNARLELFKTLLHYLRTVIIPETEALLRLQDGIKWSQLWEEKQYGSCTPDRSDYSSLR